MSARPPAKPTTAQEKKKAREARNLRAAKESRERKTMLKAHLTAEKARLMESNALLRAQLDNITGGGSSGAGSSHHRHVPPSMASGHRGHHGHGHGGNDMLTLSDSMSKLFGGRKEISSQAAVDMLDRALTGGADKPPPVDPELARLWDDAQARAPVVRKPQYYATPAAAAAKALEIQEKRKAAKEKKQRIAAAQDAKRQARRGSSSRKPS